MHSTDHPRPYRYRLFGLQIDSDLQLPELLEGDRDVPPDVTVELGPIPVAGEFEDGLHPVDGGSLLVIDDVARYFVEEGNRLVVDPVAGVSERNIRLYLLGSVAGLLAHKRGFLPLHANAIEIEGKIVAFMGESGAGKSTLAAWFTGHGFALLADDIAVVDFAGEAPHVLPGLARLRLWDAVIEATGRDPVDFALSFEGDPSYGKRDVMVNTAAAAVEPRKLGLLVELTREGPLFEPLLGARAAEAVISHTYRGAFVKALNAAQEHWAMCMRLIHAVPVYRACVRFDLNRLDDSYGPLLEQVKLVLAEQTNAGS